jgi:hypothetical protein
MNRRDFLQCSLMVPLGAGILGTTAKSLASTSRPVKYVSVWRDGLGSGAQWVNPAADWSSFAAEDKKHFDEGLRLVAISVSNVAGQLRYVGVWRGDQGNAVQWVLSILSFGSPAFRSGKGDTYREVALNTGRRRKSPWSSTSATRSPMESISRCWNASAPSSGITSCSMASISSTRSSSAGAP